MEINDSTKFNFYICRLFGLAPYKIIRDSKGRICGCKRSVFWCLYSSLLFLSLLVLIVYGVLQDATSKKPVRELYRMKSPTSKVVTSMDILVVVGACFFGTICGLVGLRNTQEINQRLREADETLSLYRNEKKDKRRGIFMLISVLLGISGTIGLDISCWYRIAAKFKNHGGYANVTGYIPFYILYYILFQIQLNLAQTALGLGKRFRRVNMALKNAFSQDKPNINVIRMSSINLTQEDDFLENKKGIEKIKQAATILVVPKPYQVVDRLASIHNSLAKGIENVSSAFGPTFVAVLASCLLHLVATSYFLLVEIVGDNDPVFTWLQTLWLTVHFLRLLLMVEPCHITYKEARKTTFIVCEMQRCCKDPDVKGSLKTFWQQLLIQQSCFSPCGMCTIDRHILTSYCGAIATYLIILMQFQKNDG